MTNEYHVGTLVTVTSEFAVDGVDADPTTLTLIFRCVQKPGTTTWVWGTDIGIVQDATGKFHANIDTTGAIGTWVYEWIGYGAAQAAGAGSFSVRA